MMLIPTLFVACTCICVFFDTLRIHRHPLVLEQLAKSLLSSLNIGLPSEIAASDTASFCLTTFSSQDRVAFCACMNTIRARKR